MDNIDYSINFYQTSQLLVLFFSNAFTTIAEDNYLLFKACYLAALFPCPVARILDNRKLYLPLIISDSKDSIYWYKK